MPRYRLREFYRTMVIQIGHHAIKPGEEFAFLDWPDHRMEATNATACGVIDYLAENLENPDSLSSPWCHYRAAVYLPRLAPAGKASAGVGSRPSEVFPILGAHKSRVTNSVSK